MSDILLPAAGSGLLASLAMTGLLIGYDRFAPASHVQQRHDFALAALLTGPLVFLIALMPRSIEFLPRHIDTVSAAIPATAGVAYRPGDLATAQPGLDLSAWIAPGLLALWAAVSLALLIVLGRDLYSLRRLLVRSEETVIGRISTLSHTVETRLSADVPEPMLAGYLRPVVYLPQDYDSEAPGSRAVLEHEIAHLQRRDTWTVLVERVMAAVFWWLVPVFLLRPILSKSRESLCDRYAAEQTGEPLVMAHALLDAAERQVRGPALALAIAGRRTALSQRIQYLAALKPSSNKAVLMKLPLILPALAALALVATPRVGAAIEIDPDRLDKLADFTGAIASSGSASRLIDAVERGDMQSLDRLLEQGMDPDSVSPGDGTALIAAVRMRRDGMVDRLLEAGANPNLASRGDGSALIEAARQGNMRLLTTLLEAGANPDLIAPGDGTALIQAAAGNHLDVAARLLEAGADTNGFAPADETPLINAARRGHVEMAELLLEAGADLSLTVPATDRRGDAIYRSALSEAQRHNQRGMLRWLEEHGAAHRPPTR
ncbi:M56 family metallopeptidase [Maricaulis sp.]|uniref:M56 family metallopeptidase n=1 Tax=Maricaulis sp. TaxID=1486257 RepID=UPI0026260934|nr:M56 family metallopeptidase [Maricaulis sp.]